MVSDKKFPIVKSHYLKVAVLTAFATLPLLLGISGQGSANPPSPPAPWTGPVPKAVCGPNDRVETGLQGHTTLAERESGFSELGFNCNLELVGQFQGEGMWWFMSSFNSGTDSSTVFDNRSSAVFQDCAYYSTRNDPLQQRRGAVVIDASDPRNPHATAHLDDTAAMLNPHESLKVHQKRQLLAGVQSSGGPAGLPGPGFAIYDLSADCRHPVLKASVVVPGDTFGHAGNFTPDGLTYYGTDVSHPPAGPGTIYAIDVTDPSNPTFLGTFPHNAHDMSFSQDGTRAYLPQIGNLPPRFPFPNGLVILDVSDIQFRRSNPEVRVISTLFWEDGGVAQSTLPVTIKGRPHIIFADEAAGARSPAGVDDPGGRLASCARGLPPSGFARIIDISDEKNPKLVSKLMLEAHDPANCPELLTTPGENRQSDYSAHYCSVDQAQNPKMVACSYFGAGIRVFDIRDPFLPKEVAYYKPPARRTAFLPGSSIWSPTATADRTVDFTPTDIRWRKHKGETHLWFSSADNGFQIVRFTQDVLRDDD